MEISGPFKIPILTYHSIDTSGSVISTNLGVFEDQMQTLSEMGFKPISLRKLAKVWPEADKEGSNYCVLTFDDGFENFYTKAFPVLEKYGFESTVFVVTDHCGGTNDWEGDLPGLPRNKLLSWKQIKELHDCGVEFGSHTRTHPDLTKLNEAEAQKEIVESKSILEDALSVDVGSFAYPYGRYGQFVRNVVRQNFDAGCTTVLRKARFESDLSCLERIDSYYLSNPRVLKALSSSIVDGYLGFRRLMRGAKASIRGN